MNFRKFARWVLPIVTVVAAVRCGSDGLKLPDRHDPAFIDVLGGDDQTGVVGRPLTDTLMVRITDSDHLPIQFQPVRFKLLAGGSAAVLIPDTAITDADGQARSKWVLGQIAGQQTVEARVISDNPASAGLNHPFHASAAADVADTVIAVKGNGQQGIVGTALTDSLAVAVTDQFGNPIPGQTVNWSVPAGQGSVSASTTTTGPDGRSAVLRILGPTAGTQTATATWPGHTPVVFTSQAGASGVNRIVKLFGDNQTAPAGQKLTDSIVVQAQDAGGNGVAGENIGWTVVSGGGSLSAASATTNAQGKAFVFWTLGTTAGPNAVKALRVGVPEVQFAATGTASQPTHIVANSSQTLSGTAGLTVTPPPSVRVLDANNNGVQGVTVTFTVTLGGGTVSDGTSNSATVTVATNATGTATLTSWTLGLVAGTNNNIVTASVTPTLTGSPVTFTATAVAGQPGRLAFIQQPTNVGAGAVITPAVTVQVQDIAGNPVGGTTLVTVAFGNNPGSATLGGTKSVNAVNGIATFNTLTVDKVGTGYTLVTTGSGLLNGTSTAFNVTAGTPFKLVFVQQPTSAAAGAVIAPPITVQVQDANNNPITTSTASIAMAIGTNPGGAALTGTTPVAAVGGLATFSNLSLNKAGTGYTLVATSGTLQPATSVAFNVGAGVATQLVFTTQPSNTPAGSVITPGVQVAVRDAQGNTITTDTRTITVAIGTNPGGGTLSGLVSTAAVAGVATFSNLSINLIGTGYTLTATDGALPIVTSAAFNIVVGNGNKLGFIVQPTTVVTGAPITPAVQVAVQDPGGNTVTTATNSITVFLAGGTGLAGTQTVAAVAGVAIFTGLNVTQAGAGRTLSATSPTLIGATSNAFTINPASTLTTITTDLPDPSAVGQAYAVNYTVAAVAPGTGTPTGNVTISDGVSTCTASVAAATCNLTSISTGAKTLTGTYTGDANYAASVSAGVAHTVNAAATTTTITGDAPDPSVVGQAYSITVTMSSGGGVPTGTVTVSEGVATCPITLAAGTGSCNLTSTTAGAKTITATYAAQGNFLGSSGTMGHQVNQAATTTVVGVDTPDPSTVGQVYAVPYTVAVTAPGVGTPTGNVTVSDGTVSCTGSVAAATCNLTSTTAGAKTLTATYSGDANFATSAGTAPHTVNGATTTTTITADPTDPSVTGQPYAITVTVTSTGGTPTGTVTVSDGAATCPITLAAGTGTCNLTSTTAGAKTLTATYAGSGNFSGSTSAGMAHQVNAAATTTTITADTPDPSVVNNPYTVSFTVAANAPGGGTPAGNVTVSDGAATCIGTVAAGNCSLTSTTTGAKTLTATYAGNANYTASPASAGVAHQVDASGTTVMITQDTPDPSVVGQPVAVTVTVTGAAPTPTGTITVTDGTVTCPAGTLSAVNATTATGTCSLAFPSAGTKSLTASYSGDGTHGASTSPAVSHGVNAAGTVTTITAHTPDPSVVGNPIAMTVSVVASAPGAGTPTGSVVVSDGTASCLATVAAPTCNLTPISAGPKTLTAQYAGDANFTTSTSAGVAHTVTASVTTTTVMTDLPEPSVPGQLVTVAFQVSSAFTTATGTVNVSDGTRTCSGTLTAGSGSCTVTYPGAGSWPLVATYAGDANHATSTSVANAHAVSAGATTTTIGAISPASTAVGAPYTVPFTVAVVAPSTGTPTGNVTVSDGTGVTCVAAVAAGNCVLTSITAGTKTVTAVYAGDANFTTSTSAGVSHVVGAAATTTTITSDPTDPSVVGQDYVVGVSVVSAGGTPTGTVNLADGTGATCAITLAAGIGSCTLNSASAGAKTLTATYTGTVNFSGSSGTTAHQVNASLTTTTIGTVTPASSAVGASYTVNYSVAATLPGTGTPTGNVTVGDGTGGTCTGTVAAGNCALSSTTAGTKTLTAAFAGSTNYSASTSAGVSHVVTAAPTTTTITNDTPDPTAVGQAYAVTVTVVSQTTGTPTGTVTVSDGTGATCPVTLAAGTGSCNLTSTTQGAKTLTAVYATDGNFAGSTSAGVAHGVNLNGTSTAVSSSVNPSTFGQGVSFTATVSSGAGTPAGTVQFKVDGANLGTPVTLNGSGQATSSSTTSMAVGTRVITAEYSGNASFAASTGTLSGGQVVGLSSTSTAVSSSVNPSTFGQGVSFTATVTSGGGTPAGTVQFKVDGANLGTPVTLNGSGQATSSSTTSMAVGTRVISAEYSGNASFAASTGTLSGGQVVGLSSTSTAVSSSTNPSTFGQGVSFTATVTSGGGTPAGTVQFKVDGANLGTPVTLNGSGQATSSSTTSMAVGTRVITAEYSGNGSFATSTGTLSGGQVVNLASTSTAVSSSANPSTFGQGVTFTATVTSGGGTPAGTVQFKVDGVNLGAAVAPNGSGQATSSSTTTLAVGNRVITAVYSGNGSFATSTGTLSGGQVVNLASTSTAVSSSANPSTFGQGVTFTATVSSGGGTPAGTVQFKVDGANLGTPVTLNGSGQATSSSTTSMAVGTRVITAEYSGNASFGVSTGTLSSGQVVNLASTSTAVSSSTNPSVFGQGVNFTATVSSGGGTPAGTVQFKVDGVNLGGTVALNGSGQATSSSTTSLAVGTRVITAVYSGNASFATSTGTLSGGQNVNQANTTTTITGHDDGFAAGTPITVTFTVVPVAPGAGTPTGNVTISDGTNDCTALVSDGGCSFTPATVGPATITITATYAGDTDFNGSSDNASHNVN